MKRAIIYVRVSTEDQLEKYGLPAQLRACRECAASLGLTVIEEIADEGITGTTLDRPGISRVRALIREQAIDVLVALDPDRLSRVLRDLLELKAEADAARVAFSFVTASYDNSPTGELFFSIKGSIAAYERKLFLERCLRGKRERAKSGRIVGGRVCFGYRYDDGKLIVNEDQAQWVRRIYGWYDSGLSMRAITLRLREMGAPTWGGRRWGKSSVGRILKNETFAGVAHYDSHTRAKDAPRRPEDRDRRRVKNKEELWIAVAVPALVPREQWDRVRARIAANPANGRPAIGFLLRGLLYCSCGQRMCSNLRRSRNDERTYRCTGRDLSRHTILERCRTTVNGKKLDAAVWDTIVRAFSDVKTLRAMLSENERRLRQAAAPVNVAQLEDQARKLKGREDRALALLLDPDLSEARSEIKRRYQEAQRERARIERELADQQRVNTAAVERGGWLEGTVAFLRDDLARMTEPEDRQRFVQGLVQRAEWANGELRMRCFLGSEASTLSTDSRHFPPSDSSFEFNLIVRLAA